MLSHPSHPAPADDFDHAFPGASVSHRFLIRSDDNPDALLAILKTVRATGCRIDAVQSTRLECTYEHRITLNGLRAAEARALTDHVATLCGIEHASVEHRIMRTTVATTSP
jgi:acetolactate synthase regulatory subunit